MSGDDVIQIPKDELEALLISASKKGAQEALERIGLGDAEAANDVRDFRELMESFRFVKKAALEAIIDKLVTCLTLMILAAAAAKVGMKTGFFKSLM